MRKNQMNNQLKFPLFIQNDKPNDAVACDIYLSHAITHFFFQSIICYLE